VQCSSCGHGWFQTHPEVDAEREAESALHDAPHQDAPVAVAPPKAVDVEGTPADVAEDIPVEPIADVEADTPAEPVADAPAEVVTDVLAVLPAEGTADVATDAPAEMVAEPPAVTPAEAETDAALQSRQIDEAVLAVLREEAEREMIARRLDAQAAVETQPDLGIDDVGLALPPTAASARHIALLKGEGPDAEPDVKRELSRREMLPDIEEINSSMWRSVTTAKHLKLSRGRRHAAAFAAVLS
jgi:hypothetical protein